MAEIGGNVKFGKFFEQAFCVPRMAEGASPMGFVVDRNAGAALHFQSSGKKSQLLIEAPVISAAVAGDLQRFVGQCGFHLGAQRSGVIISVTKYHENKVEVGGLQ